MSLDVNSVKQLEIFVAGGNTSDQTYTWTAKSKQITVINDGASAITCEVFDTTPTTQLSKYTVSILPNEIFEEYVESLKIKITATTTAFRYFVRK